MNDSIWESFRALGAVWTERARLLTHPYYTRRVEFWATRLGAALVARNRHAAERALVMLRRLADEALEVPLLH